MNYWQSMAVLGLAFVVAVATLLIVRSLHFSAPRSDEGIRRRLARDLPLAENEDALRFVRRRIRR